MVAGCRAAMEVYLVLNGREISSTLEEQENLILTTASGQISRSALIAWIEEHLVPYVR
jgi:death-on-curing protein